MAWRQSDAQPFFEAMVKIYVARREHFEFHFVIGLINVFTEIY